MDTMERLKIIGSVLLLGVIFWVFCNVVSILIMFGVKLYELNIQFLEWLSYKLFGKGR